MAKVSTKNVSITDTNNFIQFLKGLIVALIITFAGILIFALIIKFANLNDRVIVPVNLVIKALSVAVGTIIFTKSKTGGLKKGIIFAFSYITLAFVIFSALAGKFVFEISLLLDYVFAIIVGIIVGVIRVNIKQKNM